MGRAPKATASTTQAKLTKAQKKQQALVATDESAGNGNGKQPSMWRERELHAPITEDGLLFAQYAETAHARRRHARRRADGTPVPSKAVRRLERRIATLEGKELKQRYRIRQLARVLRKNNVEVPAERDVRGKVELALAARKQRKLDKLAAGSDEDENDNDNDEAEQNGGGDDASSASEEAAPEPEPVAAPAPSPKRSKPVAAEPAVAAAPKRGRRPSPK